MRVIVDVDRKILKDVEKRLGEFHKKAPNAISNALNRAATNVNSNIKKEIRAQYVIKAGDITKYGNLVKTNANSGKLSAVVKSTGGVIPLDKFKVSPKTVNPRRKTPIKIGVKKSGLKKVMDAFVADANGIKVFQRTGKERLPIKRLFGPSVPQMLGNEKIKKSIEKEGQETFQKRLDQNIKNILEKGRG